MSAIAGIYHMNNEPVSLEDSRGIMDALETFPANDISVWYRRHVFLGCHGQWVTPESVGEQLPFYDNARKLAITADAIIDNRDELFERLHVHREDRRGMPDSLLILLAYEKWKEECPKFLIGDFAFMIWDEKDQQMFGARDISGYRTLYFYHNQMTFAFCSTIEALLTLPYVEKDLNEEWLAEHLAITGTIDTADAFMTPYTYINQIPPAHSILITKNSMSLKRHGAYFTGERLNLKSSNDYVEAFQEVFQEAVKCRVRTHHHVGSQLSGGLDSGTVVGFAAQALKKENKQLHTFSYVPPDDFEDFTSKQLIADERPFITSTVEYVGGIKSHYLDFKGKDSYSEIDEMLEIMEMPYKFFENSFWLKGMFEHASTKKVGILLNGDRGNYSVSWGYALDYYSILLKRLRWLKLFNELDQYCRKVGGGRFRRLPLLTRMSFPLIDRMFPQKPPFRLTNGINPEFAVQMGVYDKLRRYGIGKYGWLEASNIYEVRKTLLQKLYPWNTGNTLISKLSLRHSLWKRDPTNDLRVVRFCLSVPEEQYVENGMDRALIRKSTKNILPDKVRLNQRIRGAQGVDWVHRMLPHWDGFVGELRKLSQSEMALKYFDGEAIHTALEKAAEGGNPKLATDPDYKLLMRSLITMRFLQKFA